MEAQLCRQSVQLYGLLPRIARTPVKADVDADDSSLETVYNQHTRPFNVQTSLPIYPRWSLRQIENTDQEASLHGQHIVHSTQTTRNGDYSGLCLHNEISIRL